MLKVLTKTQSAMSPLASHHLSKRLDSGTSFSIIFGIIAASVVIACAIWGFVIPKWRQKHPPDPSRTKWNDGSFLTTRRSSRTRTIFPTHPAVKPLLSKPSAAQILPTYDPRLESPFPDNNHPRTSRQLACTTPQTYSVPTSANTISSNGLFTPVKGTITVQDLAKNNYHTVPRAIEAKHFTSKSTDFGDAKEFILAVPEPLALRPRDAGRPPAVAQHLGKCGTTYSNSPANSDKLLHPNKLFQAIQNAEFRSSLCSSTSMRLDHRESDAAAALAAREVNEALDQAIKEGTSMDSHTQNSQHTSKASSFIGDNDVVLAHGNELTALHRLQSYRSLNGYQPPRLTRAGTVTRPKTPVNELRRFYIQDEMIASMPITFLPRITTKSTTLTVFENSSDKGSISTIATSPTIPPSSGAYRLEDCANQKTAVRNTTIKLEGSAKPTIGHETGEPPANGDEASEGTETIGDGFFRPGRRCKPTPPLIYTGMPVLPCEYFPSSSSSDVDHPFNQNHLISRARASSMYSRDTHGYSLAPTPTTPEFLSPIVDVFAEPDSRINPGKSRESVKARISEWTQRIEDNSIPLLPLLKQASLSLQVSTTPTELPDHNADDSRKNTSLAQCDANAANIATPNNVSPSEYREDAPGGASWI